MKTMILAKPVTTIKLRSQKGWGLLPMVFWLVLPCCVMAGAANKNITFSLSFDHGLEPEIAEGNPADKYLREGEEPHFVQGLKGKGLLTGKANQCAQFAAQGNVPQEEGSVIFWMKGLPGVTWNKVDKQYHSFFFLHGTNGNLIFYKYFEYANTWLFGEFFTADKQRTTSSINLPKYTEDEWHLYAFTWKGSKVSLYLDTELAGEKDDFQFPALSNASTFMVGECMGAAGEDIREEERVMDEFAIYNKALSEREIAEISRTQGEVPARQKPKDSR